MFIWDWTADNAWTITIDWLFNKLLESLNEFCGMISNMGTEIFALPWVEAIFKLFSCLGWILFVVGIIITAFDFGMESLTGRANIKDTFLNVLKGFFAVSLFVTVPVALYEFCVTLQINFGNALVGVSSIADLSAAALEPSGFAYSPIFNLLLLIALGYCVVKVFFGTIKRGGILITLIAVASLYMLSITRGYWDGFIGWCKQVIALCFTSFMQVTLLMAGLLTWKVNVLLGIGIMLSAAEVPRIANNYGLDTSTRANLMSAVYATNTVINMGKSLLLRR